MQFPGGVKLDCVPAGRPLSTMKHIIFRGVRATERSITYRMLNQLPRSMMFSTSLNHQNLEVNAGGSKAQSVANLNAQSSNNRAPSSPSMSSSAVSEEVGKDLTKTSATSAPSSSRLRKNIAPIIITEKAADRIKDMIGNANDKNGNDDIVGVKLGVKRRGCNGYSYTMNYATNEDVLPATTTNDKKSKTKYEIVQDHGVTIAVDPKAVFFIVGTKMDWSETELASEFVFINPNIKGECGCGESFNI